jgi:hypothetical protein
MYRSWSSSCVLLALIMCEGIVAGCGGKGSGGKDTCGAAGQACCSRSRCDASLTCQSGTCQSGTAACGAANQPCCQGGTACAGVFECRNATCLPPLTETISRSICAAGGQLEVSGAKLSVPRGALSACTRLTLTRTEGSAPEGYTAYSPVFDIEPAGVKFAASAALTIDVSGAPTEATAFWTRDGASGFQPVDGSLTSGTITAAIARTGQGFVAGRDYVLVCAAGETLSAPSATLTIPEGAIPECTMVKLTSTVTTPPVYHPYSPVIRIEPADLTLAAPVSLALAYSGDPDLATLFWSRVGTTGYARLATPPASGALTASLTRFGSGFVADGMNYSDPPDRSCVVGKMVEGRTMTSSAVALFYTVDDCWGRPLPGLAAADFQVLENGAAISPAESSATILPQTGVEVFASLVIDMSASTVPLLQNVVASAKAFVTNLQVTKKLPVQIDIQLFAGDAALTEWQGPTLDTDTLLARLDALASYSPTDRSSTNLNGAVVAGLERLAVTEDQFRTRNYGGAFTIGYLVLFTDGRDTAGRVTADAAAKVVNASPDQVVAAGMQSVEYDPSALEKLAPGGLITAANVGQLSTAFAAVANRMEGQIHRFYLLGYCSPKRAGASNSVAVRVVGATPRSDASYAFNATAFAPGCSADTFSTICDGRQCGGLGCGFCDDRVASCNEASSLCEAP